MSLNPMLSPPRKVLDPVQALLVARNANDLRRHFARWKQATHYGWEDTGADSSDPKGKRRVWKGTPPDKGTRKQISKPGTGKAAKKEDAPATGERKAPAKKAAPKGKKQPVDMDALRQAVADVRAGKGDREATKEALRGLTVAQLDELKRALKVRGGGTKKEDKQNALLAEAKEKAEKKPAAAKKTAQKTAPRKPRHDDDDVDNFITEAVRKHKKERPWDTSLNLNSLHQAMEKQFPGLTRAQFVRRVKALAMQGVIRTNPFTQPLITIKHPEMGYYDGYEFKYYLDVGDGRSKDAPPAQGTQRWRDMVGTGFPVDPSWTGDLEKQLASTSGRTTLPDLFDRVRQKHPNLTVPEFHDALLGLYRSGKIDLHAWTQPAITMPTEYNAVPFTKPGDTGVSGIAYWVSPKEELAKDTPAKPAAAKDRPKEGDTNAQGLVFKGGRWRREAKDEPKKAEAKKPTDGGPTDKKPLSVPAEPSMEKKPPAQAGEPETWKAVQKEYERMTKAGDVKLPELFDAVKKHVPGLTPEQFHALLWQWRNEDKVFLQRLGHPDTEERNREEMPDPNGGRAFFYVVLDPNHRVRETAPSPSSDAVEQSPGTGPQTPPLSVPTEPSMEKPDPRSQRNRSGLGQAPTGAALDRLRQQKAARAAKQPKVQRITADDARKKLDAGEDVPNHLLTQEDYAQLHGNQTHHVDAKRAPEDDSFPSDKIVVSSRGKKPWLAKLGGKDKKYGREREFIRGRETRSGMRKQIVTYTFEGLEPGEYEVAGSEFGDFRHTFTVADPAEMHRANVEKALKAKQEVPPEVLADYPDLAEKYGQAPSTGPQKYARRINPVLPPPRRPLRYAANRQK